MTQIPGIRGSTLHDPEDLQPPPPPWAKTTFGPYDIVNLVLYKMDQDFLDILYVQKVVIHFIYCMSSK